MLEFLLCSLLTILPDYLIKRYRYNKRWGKEITFFTLWYELRWGITGSLILTVSLVTLIFYYHPSTTNATSIFRTVTILPEEAGRVDEIYVKDNQVVQEGDRLFSIQDSTQLAAVRTARGVLEEVNAEFAVAQSNLAEAQGKVAEVQSDLALAKDDLRRKLEFRAKDSGGISEREVDISRSQIAALTGTLDAATANSDAAATHLNTVLPARKVTAEEALNQAIVEVDKKIIYAGVSGRLAQFALQPGDIVSPVMRPAGLLIPSKWMGTAVQAGFNQLAAQVIHPGTLAEITCYSKPFTVIPMVVTRIQPMIAAGQVRPTDQLVELQDRERPGSLLVRMEPLYADGMDGILPGTKCIANAYTNNHELIASGDLGVMGFLYYHMVDAVGIAHAVILRVQALTIPVRLLVFSAH